MRVAGIRITGGALEHRPHGRIAALHLPECTAPGRIIPVQESGLASLSDWFGVRMTVRTGAKVHLESGEEPEPRNKSATEAGSTQQNGPGLKNINECSLRRVASSRSEANAVRVSETPCRRWTSSPAERDKND